MRFKKKKCLSLMLAAVMIFAVLTNTMRVAKAVEGYDPEAAKNYAYSHYGSSSELCAGFVASCLHNSGISEINVSSNRTVGRLVNTMQSLGFQKIELTARKFNEYHYSDNSFVSVGDVIVWYCPEGDTTNNYHWKHAAIVTNVTNSKDQIQVTQTNSRVKDSTISYYGFNDCSHKTRKVYVFHHTTPAQKYYIYFHSGIGTCDVAQMTKQEYINAGYSLPTCQNSGNNFLGWSRKSEDPDEMITKAELETLDHDIDLYAVYGSLQADIWNQYWSNYRVYTLDAQTNRRGYNYFAFLVKTSASGSNWVNMGAIETSQTVKSSGDNYYRQRLNINLDDYPALANEEYIQFRLVPCKMNGELYTDYTGSNSTMIPNGMPADYRCSVNFNLSDTEYFSTSMLYGQKYSDVSYTKVTRTGEDNKYETVDFSQIKNPKKAGYYFDGYYTENGEKLDLNGTKGFTPTNVTYYARWKKQVTAINLSNSTVKLTKGANYALSYTIAPSDAGNKLVSFTSNNPAVATVNSNGQITAISAGTATITCKAKDGSGKTASCKVTVTNPVVKVKKLTLNKKSALLMKGKTLTLKATVTPANATNKKVVYTTSNSSVATVSSKGVVKAKATGIVTITCKAKGGNGIVQKCKIQVVTSKKQAFVAETYKNVYGRMASTKTVTSWAKKLAAKKTTPAKVAEKFICSKEIQNKKLSNREYVKMLYRTFKGREAKTNELKNWTKKLQTGTSRKTAMKQFAKSAAFKKIRKSYGL